MSTPFLDSPDLVFDKPESRKNVFKSLPALDSNYDQLDKELQQLSDSLGVLYEQEDSEIEFLDSFIDYDDISIIYKTIEDKEKSERETSVDDNEIVVVTDKDEEVIREIVINGSETHKKNSREKWKWWKSKGRLILRSLSCNCFKGRFSSQPTAKYEVTAERRQKESCGGSEGNAGGAEEEGEVVRVKSFHIQQEQAEIKKMESPGSDTCGGYIKAVNELENLEKLILRDSLRETFLKRRGMETIREESDLAFINLSYDMVKVDRCVLNNYYENLDQDKRIQNRYENVKFPPDSGSTTETKDEFYQYYENIPQQSTALRRSNDDEYESYDFGEEGIYQNIMFTNGSSSIKGSDLNSKVDALQQCINEVNDIIKVKPNDNQSEKSCVTLSKPTASLKEEKIETKPAANTPPPKPVRSISNNFKTWALSKAEHPKLDPNKLPRQKIVNTETFSLEERNVVTEFLKTFKEELKTN